MVVQTDERRWVYTDPEHPGHEVHISKHPAFSDGLGWFCVYLGSGRVLGHQDGSFLDALALAACWINNKGAEI